VFNSKFCEGLIPQAKIDVSKLGFSDIKSTLRTRRQVTIKDDYELFQIILYYLYTGTVQFTTSLEICSEENEIPTTTDVEGVYAITHRLMLDDLSTKAAKFLGKTCTIRNITSRAFSHFAVTYEAIEKVYDAYILEHWQDVVGGTEFEEFFRDVEDNPEEFVRVSTKLRALIRRECEMRVGKQR
jgi:hypothetical protein